MSRTRAGVGTQRRRRTGIAVALALVAGLLPVALVGVGLSSLPAAAAAPGADGAAPAPVTNNLGGFSTSVPFEVPAFHGITPNLGLQYDSARDNGFAGVGWALTGLDRIDRVSAAGGSPRFDSTDGFELNGERLVANTGLGGQYVTKRQSFERISYNATTKVWTLVDPDGIKYQLNPVLDLGLGVVTWMLTKVSDPHGNTVNYSTWCDPGKQCYPKTITYNGTLVTLFYETRPDVRTQAVGGLTRTAYRLRSIAVRVSGSMARVYKLGYTTSPATGRSELASVTRYGSDATIDAAGAVTAGSALPATTMTYQADTSGFTASEWAPAGSCQETWFWGQLVSSRSDVTVDVTGDGRSDTICHEPEEGQVLVGISDGTSRFTFSQWAPNFCPTVLDWVEEKNYAGSMFAGDVNGDGRTDLICHDTFQGNMTVAVSNGSSAFTVSASPWLTGWCPATPGFVQPTVGGVAVGDFNGDGKTDVLCSRDGQVQVALSNGSSAFTASASPWASGWCQSRDTWYPADVNGDGRVDLVCQMGDSAGALVVGLSNGSSAFTVQQWASGVCSASDGSEVFLADVNGDGRTDVLCHSDSDPSLTVAVSDGSSRFAVSTATLSCQNDNTHVADVNGDGRADIVCHVPTTGQVRVAVSNGSPAYAVSTWLSGWCQSGKVRIGDVNADGKSDVLCANTSAGTISVGVSGTRGTQNDLLVGLSNPGQSTTSVAYAAQPVPGWHGAPVPRVTEVSQSPSGGAPVVRTTFAASGPKWDPVERRFLGYSTVTATSAAGATATATFRQVAGYPTGRPSKVTVTGADGAVLTKATYAYTESVAAGVYTSLLTSTTASTCNGTSLCQSSTTSYAYDGYGNVVGELDRGDDQVTGDERYTQTVYHPSASYLVNYPASIRVYAGTSASGTKVAHTDFAYDGQSATSPPTKGDPTSVSSWSDSAGQLATHRFGYDSYGNLTSQTDPLGHATTITYDATYHLFPTKTCDALSHCAGSTWNPVLGGLTTQVDQANTGTPTTTTTYDTFGRVTKVTGPDGSWTSTSYVNTGNPTTQYVQTAVSDGTADGLWSRVYLDGLGRTYRTVAEGGATVDTTYDAQGQVATTSAPYLAGQTPQRTGYVYDGLGRTTAVALPDGAIATTAYSVAKNAQDSDFATPRAYSLECDPGGYCVRRALNGRGQVAVVDELADGAWYGARVRITYDALGRRTGYTQAGASATTSYDWLSQVTATTDPDAGNWTYGHDLAGNLTRQTDARGITVNATYDALNRVKTVTSGATTLAAYTYDQTTRPQGIGRLTAMSNASGSTTFDYDSLGRVVTSTQTISGTPYTVRRGYDSAGRVKTLTYPDGEAVTYSYDSTGCLKSVGSYVANATCTPVGALASMTLGNGLTQSYTYSAARGWLTNTTVKNASSTTLLSLNTSNRNARGQILAQSATGNANLDWTYSYDGLGRLTAASNSANPSWNQTYSYDSLGRVFPGTGGQNLTYPAAGHLHAPATHAGTAYTYDAAGNRTSDGGHTYTYDQLGQLTAITGTGATSYAYDAAGNRVQAGATKYIYLGGQVLFQQNGTNTTKFYYYGDTRVASKNQAGAVSYSTNDQLGTANGFYNASGASVGTQVFGPYGKTAQRTGTTDPFGLAGEQLDPTGLYHMGARNLDPTSATWTTPDPSGTPDPTTPQSLNRYTYAGNDPVGKVDPTGLAWCGSNWGDYCEDPGGTHPYAPGATPSVASPTIHVGGVDSGLIGSYGFTDFWGPSGVGFTSDDAITEVYPLENFAVFAVTFAAPVVRLAAPVVSQGVKALGIARDTAVSAATRLIPASRIPGAGKGFGTAGLGGAAGMPAMAELAVAMFRGESVKSFELNINGFRYYAAGIFEEVAEANGGKSALLTGVDLYSRARNASLGEGLRAGLQPYAMVGQQGIEAGYTSVRFTSQRYVDAFGRGGIAGQKGGQGYVGNVMDYTYGLNKAGKYGVFKTPKP